MIRTNLLSYTPTEMANARKYLNLALATVFVAQLILFGIRFQQARQQKSEFDAAISRLETLKSEAKKLEINADLQRLAGKVAARNNWFVDRRNSPLFLLTKLQNDCPNNVRFLSYGADLRGGRIVLTAPDLNSVSSWLNRHFNQSGNLSVTGRESNLLQIQFVWSG